MTQPRMFFTEEQSPERHRALSFLNEMRDAGRLSEPEVTVLLAGLLNAPIADLSDPAMGPMIGFASVETPVCGAAGMHLRPRPEDQAALIAAIRRDRVPARYVAATWRDMTPVDPDTGFAGIGFDTPGGEVFLRLSVEQLETVSDVICEQIAAHHVSRSQSVKLRGSERSDVRTPEGTLKCDP